MAYLLGAGALVLAVLLAVLDIALVYVLIASRLSRHGRLEALVVIPFFAICSYLLTRLARYVYRRRHLAVWQKLNAYMLLIAGSVMYGGSIPWTIYLAV